MRYLGIDFGLRRIGLAQSEGSVASSYKAIEVKNFKDALDSISKIIKEAGFDKVVVGLPEGKIGKIINGFINNLRKRGFEVVEAEETLSTQRAVREMIKFNVPREKRRVNDAYSAAIILQDYLDSQK